MSQAKAHSWADLPQTAMTDKIKRRIVSGSKLMSVEFRFEKGAVVPEHEHPHEQISHIISGKMEFTVEGEKYLLEAGDVIHIPSNLRHGAVAVEETLNLEIFSPPREDFLNR